MTLEEIKAHFEQKNEFSSMIGIKILELSDGYCKGELPLQGMLYNTYGIVHGGCIFSLADTIGGVAALSHGNQVVTLDSNIQYLSPASQTDRLIAEAKEIKYGTKVAVYDVRITNAEGALIASSTFSYFVLADKFC